MTAMVRWICFGWLTLCAVMPVTQAYGQSPEMVPGVRLGTENGLVLRWEYPSNEQIEWAFVYKWQGVQTSVLYQRVRAFGRGVPTWKWYYGLGPFVGLHAGENSYQLDLPSSNHPYLSIGLMFSIGLEHHFSGGRYIAGADWKPGIYFAGYHAVAPLNAAVNVRYRLIVP